MGASSEVEDEVNLPDVCRGPLTHRRPQVHVHEPQSLPSVEVLVLQHVGDPVEVSREVQPVEADDIPGRGGEETLDDMVTNESCATSYQHCLFILIPATKFRQERQSQE